MCTPVHRELVTHSCAGIRQHHRRQVAPKGQEAILLILCTVYTVCTVLYVLYVLHVLYVLYVQYVHTYILYIHMYFRI